MEARILKLDLLISPFGDPVGASPVLDVPVSTQLQRVLAKVCGAAEIMPLSAEGSLAPRQSLDGSPVPRSAEEGAWRDWPTDACLLATEDLWITPPLVRAFLKAASKQPEPSILAIEEGLFTAFTAPVQALGRATVDDKACRLYPLVHVPAGSNWRPTGDLALESNGLAPICIDLKLIPMELPVHKSFSPTGKIALPLTDMAAVRIGHWMHIVRANQMALLAWGAGFLRDQWWRGLWAIMRAMSLNKWRILGKLVTKGRGCDIHPSAVVEACTLGDNVKIGANAVVRFCHLGDGASVSDQCNLQYSVLGAGASVARMGMLQGCVLYPGANSGHYGLQLCVVGRDTFVGGEVVLGDFKPGGEVMVMHQGQLVSAGTNMLGCAVGHDCQVLMRATTYPGREVPNGYWILGPPHDIITKIPLNLPLGEPLISEAGVLTPYAQVIQKRRQEIP